MPSFRDIVSMTRLRLAGYYQNQITIGCVTSGPVDGAVSGGILVFYFSLFTPTLVSSSRLYICQKYLVKSSFPIGCPLIRILSVTWTKCGELHPGKIFEACYHLSVSPSNSSCVCVCVFIFKLLKISVISE